MLDQGIDVGDGLDGKMIIGVEVCPLLVDQIDSYYILLPPTFHTDIKNAIGKNKYSRYIPQFIEWLVVEIDMQRRNKTLGKDIKIGTEKLAIKLRMNDLIENRKWYLIREILDECYRTAKALGYLSEWGRSDGVEMLVLNQTALPKKSATSAQKKRNLYPKKAQLSTQKKRSLKWSISANPCLLMDCGDKNPRGNSLLFFIILYNYLLESPIRFADGLSFSSPPAPRS